MNHIAKGVIVTTGTALLLGLGSLYVMHRVSRETNSCDVQSVHEQTATETELTALLGEIKGTPDPLRDDRIAYRLMETSKSGKAKNYRDTCRAIADSLLEKARLNASNGEYYGFGNYPLFWAKYYELANGKDVYFTGGWAERSDEWSRLREQVFKNGFEKALQRSRDEAEYCAKVLYVDIYKTEIPPEVRERINSAFSNQ